MKSFLNDKTSKIILAAGKNPLTLFALLALIPGAILAKTNDHFIFGFSVCLVFFLTLAFFVFRLEAAKLEKKTKSADMKPVHIESNGTYAIQQPFEVGDAVVLVGGGKKEYYSPEFGTTTWSQKMAKFCGTMTCITAINLETETCRVEADEGTYHWHFSWIKKVKKTGSK